MANGDYWGFISLSSDHFESPDMLNVSDRGHHRAIILPGRSASVCGGGGDQNFLGTRFFPRRQRGGGTGIFLSIEM